MAPPAILLARAAMGKFPPVPQYRRMHRYPYQMVHGHIIVLLDGTPCVLDTGSPFSLGYAPLVVGGREFAVQDSYMDVCPAYLADHIGTRVEGLIGADILANYTICIRPPEQMIEFSNCAPDGERVLLLQEFMNVPILSIKVNGRVVRAFLDTGAPLSYLLPEQLAGLQAEGRQEEFYPLLGNFMTDVYTLDVGIGGEMRAFRFGELPEELRTILEAGRVQAIIGTELIHHFGICFSLSDKIMRLDPARRQAVAC